MLLVLSHGQTTVERGISTNKQVETEIMHEESVENKNAFILKMDHNGVVCVFCFRFVEGMLKP